MEYLMAPFALLRLVQKTDDDTAREEEDSGQETDSPIPRRDDVT